MLEKLLNTGLLQHAEMVYEFLLYMKIIFNLNHALWEEEI